MRFVIMKQGTKMNIHQAIKWFDSDEMIIIKALRMSERGALETIYILGAAGSYGVNMGDAVDYITDTGYGYGGKGKLRILDINLSGKRYNNKIMTTSNVIELNEKIKLSVWVLK